MNRIDPTGMIDESRGADGMTNSQWMNASNPNNYGAGLESNYRNQNRAEDIDKERKRGKIKKSVSDGLKSDAEDGDGEDGAPDWVKELMDPEYDSNEGSKAAYVIPRAIPLAAVDGPVPIADAIVAVGVAAALAYDAALRTDLTLDYKFHK